MPTYAVYFTKAFAPGAHWTDHLPEPASGEKFEHGKHRIRADDPDRKQHWREGDLWSVGTSVADPLPAHFAAKEIPEPTPGATWDRDALAFVEAPPKRFANRTAQILHDAGFHDAAEFLASR